MLPYLADLAVRMLVFLKKKDILIHSVT